MFYEKWYNINSKTRIYGLRMQAVNANTTTKKTLLNCLLRNIQLALKKRRKECIRKRKKGAKPNCSQFSLFTGVMFYKLPQILN